jgi:hypothetical protein
MVATSDRCVSRKDERGTAIFVVVLVITLLTGIGLFAARVTGSVDAATGYARQAAQARALAIYAAQMAPGVLATDSASILIEMNTAKSAPSTKCPTNRLLPMDCAVRNHHDLVRISNASVKLSDALLAAQTETAPGSFGPSTGIAAASGLVAGLEGNLNIEYFERVAAPPVSGNNKGGNNPSPTTPFEYGITASAQIRSMTNATSEAWCASDDETSNANVQAIRMYVTVP